MSMTHHNYAQLDVGIGIWKYRDIGLVSILPTHS